MKLLFFEGLLDGPFQSDRPKRGTLALSESASRLGKFGEAAITVDSAYPLVGLGKASKAFDYSSPAPVASERSLAPCPTVPGTTFPPLAHKGRFSSASALGRPVLDAAGFRQTPLQLRTESFKAHQSDSEGAGAPTNLGLRAARRLLRSFLKIVSPFSCFVAFCLLVGSRIGFPPCLGVQIPKLCSAESLFSTTGALLSTIGRHCCT